MKSLNARAWAGFVFLHVVLGLLLFVPAQTVRYWQGWVYLAIFFTTSGATTLYLMKHDPALLERRVNAGPGAEKEVGQKIVQVIASVAFAAFFVVSAFDKRLGWSHVPVCVVILGDVLVIIGFLIVFLVFRENPFAAATVEVDADQKVISTGPYAVVRHPMYSGAILMLFGSPVALGSWWAEAALILFLPALIWRLLDEERVLSKELPGYTEYKTKVRCRLVPYLW
jgi:protein-S-isoprenylcysteine O-methyltransferase Ste14